MKKAYESGMDSEIMDLCLQHKSANDSPFTHTSLEPTGKYCLKGETLRIFYINYCNRVRKGKRLTFSEKPLGLAPLRADIDFRQGKNSKRIYTKQDVTKIVSYYQEVIEDIVDENSFDVKMLYCFVLEKSKPSLKDDGTYGDGIHLHFPFFVCQQWVANELFRVEVTKKILENNLFPPERGITNVDKMIDKIASKTWYMYGSSRYLSKEPYLLTRIINDENKEYIPKAKDDKSSLCVAIEKLFKNEMKNKKCSGTYYLPQFLSIRAENLKEIPLKSNIIEKKVTYTVKPRKKQNIQRFRSDEEISTDICSIRDKKLMEMLSDDRADNYDLWMDVGWTLYNISEGRDDGLDLWIEFSKRSQKFKEGECEQKWDTMELKGKSMGSLMAMAKEDNAAMYHQMREADIDYLIDISIMATKPNETDIGNVIYCMYKDKFKCVDMRGDKYSWYEFKNHRWFTCDSGVSVLKLIVSDVKRKYLDYRMKLNKLSMEYHEKAHDSDSDDDKRTYQSEFEKIETKMKKCQKIIDFLKETSNTGKCMKYLKMQFYDSVFDDKKDTNSDLFCCENGVIDLDAGIFRQGRPEDNCTKSCGVLYDIEYSTDHEDVQFLMNKLRQVYPNKRLFQYFLSSVSLCMRAGNYGKRFYIWTGPYGNNAKSTIGGLVASTFGDYCGVIPRELFINMRNQNSGGARADLTDLRNTRIAMGSEVTKKDTFNLGVIKQMTGNDLQWVRGLYDKKGVKAEPSFTVVMQCNVPPKIPSDDQASWNRIRIVDHESTFDDNAPEDELDQIEQKHFPADKEFIKSIKQYASVFLWILFEEYKKLKKNNLYFDEPTEVSMSTEKYRETHDIYKQFIVDSIEIIPEEETDDKPQYLKIQTAYTEFKLWYDVNYPGLKEKIGKIDFQKEVTKKLGHINYVEGKGWRGYRLRHEDEDEEEQVSLRQMMLSKTKK